MGSQSFSGNVSSVYGHAVPVSLSFLPLLVKILWEIPLCVSLVLGKSGGDPGRRPKQGQPRRGQRSRGAGRPRDGSNGSPCPVSVVE